MPTYKNADGLYVSTGLSEAKKSLEGSTNNFGHEREIIIDLDYTRLPTFGTASTFVNDVPTVAVPKGALLKSATLTVTTAFTGTGATLDIGLAKSDGTAIDADGIDAAIALTAIDAIGETVTCDGALIGTVLANTGFVTVDVGVATYTAGRGKLVIKYFMPEA